MNQEYEPKNFWNKRYKKFDITTSGHIDLPFEFNQWMYKLKLLKIKKAFLKYIDKSDIHNTKIVELGCGTGVYIKQWKELGVENLIGIDISSEATNNLMKEHPKYKFYDEDLSSDQIPVICGDKSADVVTAIGVLVHIVDDDEFRKSISNISKIVKNDGIVIITEYLCRNEAQDKKYMKIRSFSWYKEELLKAGLEMVWQNPLYYFMGRPYDTPTRLSSAILNSIFKVNRRLICRFPRTMGYLLYMIDKSITPFIVDGPSEELLIFRKITQ